MICVLGLTQINLTRLSKQQRHLIVVFFIFFLLITFSVINSENLDEAFRKLVLKLPILFFPLALFSFLKLQSATVQRLSFIVSYALFLPAVVSVYNYFINKELFDDLILQSKPLPIEMGYGIYHIQFSIILASVILFGIITLHLMFKNRQLGLLFYSLLILVVVNMICIHILSARTGLLALYIGIVLWLISQFRSIGKKQLRWLLPLMLIVPVVLFYSSSSLRNRMKNTIEDFNVVMTHKDANDYSFALRVRAWQNAIDVIKQHPVFGTGLGDAEQVLFNNFESVDASIAPHNRKNPHFQLMETAVQSGLICGLLYLMIFIVAWIRYEGAWNFKLIAFAMLYFVASCFESILERQASDVAFVFFIALGAAYTSIVSRTST